MSLTTNQKRKVVRHIINNCACNRHAIFNEADGDLLMNTDDERLIDILKASKSVHNNRLVANAARGGRMRFNEDDHSLPEPSGSAEEFLEENEEDFEDEDAEMVDSEEEDGRDFEALLDENEAETDQDRTFYQDEEPAPSGNEGYGGVPQEQDELKDIEPTVEGNEGTDDEYDEEMVNDNMDEDFQSTPEGADPGADKPKYIADNRNRPRQRRYRSRTRNSRNNKFYRKRMTANEEANNWLQGAPKAIRQVVANAIRQENQVKSGLIRNILNNPGNRFKPQYLASKSATELRAMADLASGGRVPSPTSNNYLGASAPTHNYGALDDPSDVLPLPTMDWKAGASSTFRRKRA